MWYDQKLKKAKSPQELSLIRVVECINQKPLGIQK